LCASSNHCLAGNIHILGDSSPVVVRGKRRRNADDEVTEGGRVSPRKKKLRLHVTDDKIDILNAYVKWKEGGSKEVDSPIAQLKEKYKCHRNYPAKLYNKVLKTGGVMNQWETQPTGRPVEYGEEVWDEMVLIIREHRARQLAPSGRTIHNQLLKTYQVKDVPSITTINVKKKAMKFKIVKVEHKPVLTEKKMKERETYAKKELRLRRASSGKHAKWDLTVIIDEKWFTEEKPVKAQVLARKGSPLGKGKFKSKGKETRTQLVKLMYLCAVSPTKGPIGYWKLNWSGHTRYDSKTGRDVPAKVDSELLKRIWPKIHAKAVQKFGQSHDIRLVVDKASSHTSKKTKQYVKDAGFDDLVIQSASSPDFSMLDASIFPSLEKECNKQGAQTVPEIEAAVRAIWRKVNLAECEKAARRVEMNMEESVKLKGGNYYSEGRKRKADRR